MVQINSIIYLHLQTAAPKQWIAYDGKVTKMDTPFTLRAQQLRDLYNSVTLQGLNRDERLDVLLTLKCTVKVGISLSLTHTHTHTHIHSKIYHYCFFPGA